jgi:hypothetical protein
VVSVSLALAASETFTAKLAGSDEVPAVQTSGKGEVVFKLSADNKSMTYKLKVREVANVTAAHIHAGMKGENGPPIVGLFAGPKKDGAFSGELVKGTITEKELIGPLTGKALSDLVTMIKSGRAYVNVHTVKNPGGEIRGQLK